MQFVYTLKSKNGSTQKGTIESDSLRSAAHKLRSSTGSVVLSLEEVEKAKTLMTKGSAITFSIALKEKVLFAVNLSVMVGSGLSVSRSLENLAQQTKSKSVRNIIFDIHRNVVQGVTMSDAMKRHSVMFNNLFVSMVRVGEIGGNLAESLTIVAGQLQKEQHLRSRVRGAMLYPMIVVFAMIGVGVLMLTYILPQIMGVFDDMDVTLPKTTQMIILASDFLRNNAVVVMISSVIVFVSFFMFLKTSLGKRFLSMIAIYAPIVKNISIPVNCARFSRIHSSLLRSGVSVVESLTIVRDTLDNVYYKEALQDAIKSVEKGIPLADTIRKYPKIFPLMVPQMIDVGEETGKTSAMLLKIAEFYELRVDQMTKNLSSIIEPLLMLMIGIGVGFFAVAMLKPMYSVLENIN